MCGQSVLELIGNTPLLRFKRVTEGLGAVQVYAKAEWYNPGGSVKDRAAMAMILDGERRGLLTRELDVGVAAREQPQARVVGLGAR